MRIYTDNFAKQTDKIADSNIATTITYAYEIFLQSGSILALNSSGEKFTVNGQEFMPFSSINLVKGEFNDSSENYIILNGVFETDAINKDMNIAGCRMKIYSYFDGVLSPLVTYFITEFEKNDLDFSIKCEPETTKYNQSLLLRFSKTCRANFGDNKCGIDINAYKKSYRIESIKSRFITLLDMEATSGYYNLGHAWFIESNKPFSFKIISHYDNQIELEEHLEHDLQQHQQVSLTPNCDKNFITCCNKFNNAVNFRGEPTIDEHNFLKK